MKATPPVHTLTAEALIAPCGMNCGICMAYLREKNTCKSCRATDEGNPVTRIHCRIKTCEHLPKKSASYCFECAEFPCQKIKQIDKRYRTKYHMSMIENLTMVQQQGMKAFLKQQQQQWKCPTCDHLISCHNLLCAHCQADVFKARKLKDSTKEV
ncbi:MAG: DUF3795 domain-containing protein [Candidatus Thermoplasmatota archaeon]|nr:DUF3795 domain-containing protein [Candidatus Thermoplasmatota archaeon]